MINTNHGCTLDRSLTRPPAIIDVHMHCFTGRRQAATVDSGLEKLRSRGLRNIVVAGLVNTHLDSRAMWKLMPDYVDHRGDPGFNEVNDLLELARLSDQFILPFVDTRHLWGDVSAALHDYIRKGFRGINGASSRGYCRSVPLTSRPRLSWLLMPWSWWPSAW